MTLFMLLTLLMGNDVAERNIHAHLRFLADDLLEGRETTYRGQKLAAKYIESNFSRFGLESLWNSDGNPYFQHFNLYRSRVNPESTVLILGNETLHMNQDFIFPEINPEEGLIAGEMLFIGSPYRSQKENYNGIDDAGLEGKVIIAIDGYPAFLADKFSDSNRRRENLRDKQVKWLEKAGAKAVIFINASEFGLPDRMPEVNSESRRNESRLTKIQIKLGGTGFPVINLANGIAARVFAAQFPQMKAHLQTLAETQKPGTLALTGEASVKTVFDYETLETENVVGVVRGSDPQLRQEYLVISAHYDHLGIHGSEVFNGADDNASGSSLLIDLARRISAKPLKRSVIFLSLSGEEKGLLGSAFFVMNSPIPLEQIIANVNIDMVGRNEIETIGMIPAANEDVTSLNEVAEAVNAKLDQPFRFLKDLDQYHRRSDHYNFCKKNIPAIFFYSGDHEDYHKSTDTWEKINYAKIVRVGALVERLLIEVGNGAERPHFLQARGANEVEEPEAKETDSSKKEAEEESN